MTEVVRAYMSGIITLIWLIYCCIMAASNISSLVRSWYSRKKGENSGGEIGPSVAMAQAQQSACLDVFLGERMGCLCCGPSPSKPRCLCRKISCPMVITFLLIVEGVLLLTPVFAATSSYSSLNNGEIEAVFPNAALAPDARSSAFSFGAYMLPGGFSLYGGYSNSFDGKQTTTFKYKDGCKPECELDVHIPSRDNASDGYPVIFHVHGGGWDSGVKSNPITPIGYWLERGYAFISMQYRFPSQTPGGATVFEILDDVQDAWDYVTTMAPDKGWGIDISRSIFYGDSAGGHLACTVAYRSSDPRIRGVVNMYGATEWEYYMKEGGGSLETLLNKILPPDPTENDYRKASCSTFATLDSPPILTLHGNWDTIVPIKMSRHLHGVVNAFNVTNHLVEVPLADHVFDAGWHSVGGQMTTYAMERFVASQVLS
eukprot:CAMPEP_0113556460 /NCGR_PEP_ID=MMETSP0015_2-20120614/17267_1 /TAXON_ID=2838 /ORGANISM="Odontella" /LENGTH=428 /DNA_ID=CAMNT_0000457815 /DNA_START=414 /DNA_END=1700 /DNA_ORIENTATION=+ /assembly_acc=CAM_ASM_000160